MTFESVYNQLRRIQTPDDEFLIEWNRNGQCSIRIGEKQFRLNFKMRKMYRNDEKVDFKDMVPLLEPNDLKSFIIRHGAEVMSTTKTRNLKGIREIELLFAYLSQYWDIPLTYDVFVCNGVTKTNGGMVLKRGKPLL